MNLYAEVPITLFSGEHIPTDAGKVGNLGCHHTRQFEIFKMDGAFMLKEVGVSNGHIAMLETSTIFNKMAVAVLKANDGLPVAMALDKAFDGLTR